MSTNELRRIANDIEDDGYEASATLIGSAADLIDGIAKHIGLPDDTDFAAVWEKVRAWKAEIEAGRAFMDRLRAITASAEWEAVWTSYHAHGGRYRGDQWTDVRNAWETARAKTDALGGPGGKAETCELAGWCHKCDGPVYHRPGQPGEFDHECSSQPKAEAQEGDC